MVIESISRLARNTKDLLDLVEKLHAKGVELISLKEKLDTSTPQGQFTVTMFAAVEAYPQVGLKLSEKVAALHTNEEKAACIWLFIQTRNKSKGSFAQALSKIIREQAEKLAQKIVVEKPFCVPPYIKKAIYAVTEEDSNDERTDT